MTEEKVLKNTILRVLVGSEAYGLNIGDSGDRDEKGVFIESYEDHCGFSQAKPYEYRDAALREGKHDAPSQKGDLDLVLYPLRKFLTLALGGNPSIIELLFIKEYVKVDALGMKLQELAPHIVSKRAGQAFLGYMEAQKYRLMTPFLDEKSKPREGFEWLGKLAQKFDWTLRKQGGKDVNRPELVGKFGFDTKYAMHMLRLGYQGIELLEAGKITVRVEKAQAELLKRVRTGGVLLPDVLETAGTLENRLIELIDEESSLPETGNGKLVEDWMLNIYWNYWRAQRLMFDTMNLNYDFKVH